MSTTSREEFRAFGSYGAAQGTGTSWKSSLAASSVIYILVGLLVMSIPVTKHIIQSKPIQLTFVEKVVRQPPPPPPPPPKLDVKPVQAPQPHKPQIVAPAAAAAPVIRPDQKIRKLDKPPPRKKFEAPKEMPKEVPKEVDASLDKGIAVYGDTTKGDTAGLEGGTNGGVAGGEVGGVVGGAIALPDDAEPPAPMTTNQKPEYPQEARAAGRESMVVLKIVVQADGTVGKVEVVRGEEPFLSAAIAAVKAWTYEPAKYQGKPIAVYRIIQMPFRLA